MEVVFSLCFKKLVPQVKEFFTGVPFINYVAFGKEGEGDSP